MQSKKTLLAAAIIALLSTAAFADQMDNPEYTQWSKYKAGTSITMKQSIEMAATPDAAAAAAMPPGMNMASMMPQTTTTTKLTEVKPDSLTLEMTISTSQMGQTRDTKTTRTIPAKMEKPTTLPSAAPGTQPASVELKDMKEGKETLDINGKKIDTVTREYTAKTNTAGGAADSHIKAWTSTDVPGGTVKMESTTSMPQIGNMTTKTALTDITIVK